MLYFSILKTAEPQTKAKLVEAALQGVAKFAHLVNVDFFRDLMKVLRSIIAACRASTVGDIREGAPPDGGLAVRLQLLCISTAFQLLTGQGKLQRPVSLLFLLPFFSSFPSTPHPFGPKCLNHYRAD